MTSNCHCAALTTCLYHVQNINSLKLGQSYAYRNPKLLYFVPQTPCTGRPPHFVPGLRPCQHNQPCVWIINMHRCCQAALPLLVPFTGYGLSWSDGRAPIPLPPPMSCYLRSLYHRDHDNVCCSTVSMPLTHSLTHAPLLHGQHVQFRLPFPSLSLSLSRFLVGLVVDVPLRGTSSSHWQVCHFRLQTHPLYFSLAFSLFVVHNIRGFLALIGRDSWRPI